jgi:hypothetical protein
LKKKKIGTGGMHEISLLQYDKMDRKERIKTGYSLGKDHG